ncbi:MAG TPA: AbrB/MazE/SpoVT family DNA-binding domain-containing protein [Chloroflexota bacterium]|jgi:AbrB family looped-hinge helix DNA binding protein|nr:AbrB/MazE/SpoVT family DNA-binding domain-containing protein [Chloroflexota bacterium]
MREFTVVVTRKGQVTVPAEVRRALGIKVGDRVAFSVDDADGKQATLKPARSVAERTFGILRRPGRPPLDVHQARRIVADDMAERDAARRG